MGGEKLRSIQTWWKYDGVVSLKLNSSRVTGAGKESLGLNAFETCMKMTKTGLLIQTTWW